MSEMDSPCSFRKGMVPLTSWASLYVNAMLQVARVVASLRVAVEGLDRGVKSGMVEESGKEKRTNADMKI